MNEIAKLHTYAVQWIDHGGDYHEPQWEAQIPTALKQMGLDPTKVLVGMGSMSYKSQYEWQNDLLLYGYIETIVELPQWEGLKKESPRWVEEISLWFYTFEPQKEQIVEKFSMEEFENLYHGE